MKVCGGNAFSRTFWDLCCFVHSSVDTDRRESRAAHCNLTNEFRFLWASSETLQPRRRPLCLALGPLLGGLSVCSLEFQCFEWCSFHAALARTSTGRGRIAFNMASLPPSTKLMHLPVDLPVRHPFL